MRALSNTCRLPASLITTSTSSKSFTLHHQTFHLTLPTDQQGSQQNQNDDKMTASPSCQTKSCKFSHNSPAGKHPGQSSTLWMYSSNLLAYTSAPSIRASIAVSTQKSLPNSSPSLQTAKSLLKFGTMLQATYLVVLEKDPVNKQKHRPLGISSAIRCITAVYIINKYRATFAEHLLPFNYTLGISGGVDFIVNVVRLGIDKYISEPERNGSPPK